MEYYLDFLSARRELLAQAANNFLDSLVAGTIPEKEIGPSVLERIEFGIPGEISTPAEEDLLLECNAWIVANGLPEGEFLFELTDPVNNQMLAVLDLAWPEGLQEGLSKPVALLIDEGRETEEAANRAGYRYFTDLESFRSYVCTEILALGESCSDATNESEIVS